MFVTELVFEHSKLKLRVFLTGCIVAMVTCFIKRITTTCLPTLGICVIPVLYDHDTMKQWEYRQRWSIRSISDGKSWKLLSAILKLANRLITYFPFKMPIVKVMENKSLSFSNNDRQTLEYTLCVKCSFKLSILSSRSDEGRLLLID